MKNERRIFFKFSFSDPNSQICRLLPSNSQLTCEKLVALSRLAARSSAANKRNKQATNRRQNKTLCNTSWLYFVFASLFACFFLRLSCSCGGFVAASIRLRAKQASRKKANAAISLNLERQFFLIRKLAILACITHMKRQQKRFEFVLLSAREPLLILQLN